MTVNLVDVVLTPEKVTTIMTALTTVEETLPPPVKLAPENRKSMLKMGVQGDDFVDAALTVAVQNPDVIPAAIDVSALKRDVALVKTLKPIITKLAQLLEGLEDTSMQAGSEAFGAALEIYHVTKTMGKTNARLDKSLQDMAQRFKKAPHKPQPPESN